MVAITSFLTKLVASGLSQALLSAALSPNDLIPITALPADFNVSAIGKNREETWKCIPILSKPTPTQDDCHRAIEAITGISKTGYIDVDKEKCLRREEGTCAAVICNLEKGNVLPVNAAIAAMHMTDPLLYRCINNGMAGSYDLEDNRVALGLYSKSSVEVRW